MALHWFPDNSLICNFAAVDEFVAFGEVTAQRAYTIAVAIEQADRPILRMPTSSRDLS